MEKFLDKKTLRALEIVKLFFDIEADWTISEISKELDISYKTVKKDLEHLKTKFDEEYNDKNGASFTTDGTTYLLDIPDNFNYKKVYESFLKESLPYLFLRDLLLNKEVSKYQFMSKYYIGYSAFLKKYPIVQTVLADFELKLEDTTIIEIVGEEKQIRLFAMYFFLEDYNYCGNCDELEKVVQVDELLTGARLHIGKNMGYFFDFFEMKKYAIIISVVILRIIKGKRLKDSSEFDEYVKSSLLYETVSSKIRQDFKKYVLTEEELFRETVFLVALIRTQPALEGNEKYNQKNLAKHQKQASIGLLLTEIFIQEIEQDVFLSKYDHMEFLLNNLISAHYQALHFTCSFRGFRDENPNMDYRESKIFDLLEHKSEALFEKMLEILTPDQHSLFLRNKDFLFFRYYGILRGIITPDMFLKPVHIKVVSIRGNYIEKDVELKIGINLSDFNIKVVDIDDEHLDILIIDTIDNEAFADFSASIFTYSGIFTQQDYVRLRKKVTSIEELKT